MVPPTRSGPSEPCRTARSCFTPSIPTVGNALEASIKKCNADKPAAAALWKRAQNASESFDELRAVLDDPGFEFTSQPHRIAYFAAFLKRIGSMKSEVGDWKDLFWETAYGRQGD